MNHVKNRRKDLRKALIGMSDLFVFSNPDSVYTIYTGVQRPLSTSHSGGKNFTILAHKVLLFGNDGTSSLSCKNSLNLAGWNLNSS